MRQINDDPIISAMEQTGYPPWMQEPEPDEAEPTEQLSVGQAIKAARERAGLTQRELAKRAGISRTHVARIEVDMQGPRLFTAELLADALRISIDELVGHKVARHDAPRKLAQHKGEEKTGGWISVLDRLPELHSEEVFDDAVGDTMRWKESDPVLVWLSLGNGEGYITIGHYEDWGWRQGFFDNGCDFVGEQVTHWMPLPDPPKEEEIK